MDGQQVAMIQINDTLTLGEQKSISAHQILLIDNSITVVTLLQHDKLLDCLKLSIVFYTKSLKLEMNWS